MWMEVRWLIIRARARSSLAAFLPDGAGHHGHGAGDALIAAARIAHDGHHDPGHAGVGRGGGQTDGEGGQVIGKDMLAHPGIHGFAHAQTVLAGKAFLGHLTVHARGFKDEADLFQRRGGGEFVDPGQGQGPVGGRSLVGFRRHMVFHQGAVLPDTGDVVMAVTQLGGGAVPVGMGRDQAVQQQVVVRQVQFHCVGGHHGPGGFGLRGIERGQALQAKGALPAQGTGSGGDGQAHLAVPGDMTPHAVLEQIGTDGHVQAFRLPAQRLGGTGRGQRHGDGFGAAQGGHHFLMQQGQDGLPVGKRQTHAFSGPEAHDVEGWSKERETGSRG